MNQWINESMNQWINESIKSSIKTMLPISQAIEKHFFIFLFSSDVQVDWGNPNIWQGTFRRQRCTANHSALRLSATNNNTEIIKPDTRAFWCSTQLSVPTQFWRVHCETETQKTTVNSVNCSSADYESAQTIAFL